MNLRGRRKAPPFVGPRDTPGPVRILPPHASPARTGPEPFAMNFSFEHLGTPLGWMVGIATLFLNLVIFWRIMRAHERLAAAIEKFERVTRPGEGGGRV